LLKTPANDNNLAGPAPTGDGVGATVDALRPRTSHGMGSSPSALLLSATTSAKNTNLQARPPSTKSPYSSRGNQLRLSQEAQASTVNDTYNGYFGASNGEDVNGNLQRNKSKQAWSRGKL
jgi:hypothetical protein